MFNRRTATKVKDGRVQRKNRHRPTGHDGYILDRESAGRGFHHVVTKRDVQAFIDIIPEWQRFSERLERIVLASHNNQDDGRMNFIIVRKLARFFFMLGLTIFGESSSHLILKLTKRFLRSSAFLMND